jgi:maleate isomerase
VTAARATLDLLRRLSVTRIALVTPYTRAGQARSIASFAAKGFDIVGERHAGMSDNLSQGAVPSDEIEAETSLPVVDSAAAGVWTASGPRASTRAPSGAGAASSPLTTSTGPARTGREGAGDGVPRRPAGRLGHGLYRRTGAAS